MVRENGERRGRRKEETTLAAACLENSKPQAQKEKKEKKPALFPHQRQVLRGGLLDRGTEVRVEVDDILQVEAQLRRVLVEGVTV
jgi:hypothetical protein